VEPEGAIPASGVVAVERVHVEFFEAEQVTVTDDGSADERVVQDQQEDGVESPPARPAARRRGGRGRRDRRRDNHRQQGEGDAAETPPGELPAQESAANIAPVAEE
jgi:hypothetical protein